MSTLRKITYGFVTQQWVDGKYVGQEFTAGDRVDLKMKTVRPLTTGKSRNINGSTWYNQNIKSCRNSVSGYFICCVTRQSVMRWGLTPGKICDVMP